MILIKIIDAYTDALRQWFICFSIAMIIVMIFIGHHYRFDNFSSKTHCAVINLFFRALATFLLDGLKSKMTEKPGSDGYG